MAVNTASGAKFYIGTTAAADILSEFIGDTYIEVGEVEDLGEFGDESEEVTFTSLGDSRVRKFKGPRNAATITVVCGDDSSDDGQSAMIAAEANDTNDYNFKVQLNDQLTISGSPSVHYFRGKVMSKRLNVGNASNVVRRNFNVGINSPILSVDPT